MSTLSRRWHRSPALLAGLDAKRNTRTPRQFESSGKDGSALDPRSCGSFGQLPHWQTGRLADWQAPDAGVINQITRRHSSQVEKASSRHAQSCIWAVGQCATFLRWRPLRDFTTTAHQAGNRRSVRFKIAQCKNGLAKLVGSPASAPLVVTWFRAIVKEVVEQSGVLRD